MPKRYIPKYYFTGESSADSDEQYWYIYLKSTGHISFDWPKNIDVFLVGGGGAGGNGAGAGGGGGGYTATGKNISIADHTDYSIVVGRGGEGGDASPAESNGNDGQPSTAFGLVANGGMGGKFGLDSNGDYTTCAGGNGGSGGGAGTYEKEQYGGAAGYGGSNGSAGGRSRGAGGRDGAMGGSGQGSNTYAFSDSRYALYAGGGGGYNRQGAPAPGGEGGGGHGQGEGSFDSDIAAQNGEANTGGGGGGGLLGGAGGTGIVIIRGTEQDYLPVFFEDTRLQEIWYNGTRCDSLIFNGQQLY